MREVLDKAFEPRAIVASTAHGRLKRDIHASVFWRGSRPSTVPGCTPWSPPRAQKFKAKRPASTSPHPPGKLRRCSVVEAGDVAPGRVLWCTRLAAPCRLKPAPLDGITTGVLSTPDIDVARHRLYMTLCDPQSGWQAYALDTRNGEPDIARDGASLYRQRCAACHDHAQGNIPHVQRIGSRPHASSKR
jgi:hypothetical protein